MRLPDFIIIGAMKAGTSSVHRYLKQHPEVFGSARKEVDFFTHHYDRGLEWYSKQFAVESGVGIAGESSPNYMKAHMWPDTAHRIHEHLPTVRLLCMLRNPVDRTLSHYLHNVSRARERRPFSRIIKPDSKVMLTSRYAWQLDHFLRYFRTDQVMLATTEELERNPEGTMRRVMRFLGVDDTVRIDTSERRNVTAVNLANSGAQVPEDPALVVDGRAIAFSGCWSRR